MQCAIGSSGDGENKRGHKSLAERCKLRQSVPALSFLVLEQWRRRPQIETKDLVQTDDATGVELAALQAAVAILHYMAALEL